MKNRIGNRFKSKSDQKRNPFNFISEIPLKINRTKKQFTKNLKSCSILYERNQFKNFSDKK